MILSELMSQEHTEKEEIRDYIYNSDLNQAMYISIERNNPIVEYCASGYSISKSKIANIIGIELNRSARYNTIIGNANHQQNEKYNPSDTWLIKTLRKKPTPISKGIKNTIKFMKENLGNSPTRQRLSSLYDQISQRTSEAGIDLDKQLELQNHFFTKDILTNKWIGHEAIWKPTGIVFGYPFPAEIINKLESLRRSIQEEAGLNDNDVWMVDLEKAHTTVVSYSHFSEEGLSLRRIPKNQMSIVKNITNRCPPISIDYNGIVVADNGAVLIKGYVDNEDLFELRKELLTKIKGISQRPQNLVHITLMYIMSPIAYETVDRVQRKHNSYPIGRVVMDTVKTSQGDYFNLEKMILT